MLSSLEESNVVSFKLDVLLSTRDPMFDSVLSTVRSGASRTFDPSVSRDVDLVFIADTREEAEAVVEVSADEELMGRVSRSFGVISLSVPGDAPWVGEEGRTRACEATFCSCDLCALRRGVALGANFFPDL